MGHAVWQTKQHLLNLCYLWCMTKLYGWEYCTDIDWSCFFCYLVCTILSNITLISAVVFVMHHVPHRSALLRMVHAKLKKLHINSMLIINTLLHICFRLLFDICVYINAVCYHFVQGSRKCIVMLSKNVKTPSTIRVNYCNSSWIQKSNIIIILILPRDKVHITTFDGWKNRQTKPWFTFPNIYTQPFISLLD